VLDKLKIKPAGGNYQTIKKYIKKYKINTSHFKGQGWSKGDKIGPKRSIQTYLNNEKFIQSFKLKNRLIRENIFEHKCMNCDGTEWQKIKIPLELHHKDGNNSNNNLSNLELLCPNCHALTDNYRGKNKK
jgi:hypothetical protein